MTQEDLNRILELDSYHIERKNPSEAEIRLYLREVDYRCPLCGKELQTRRQKKPNQKLFQIAHIYPNRPTVEQYCILKGVDRLGENSESFENKIALCPSCHATQDYHTTTDEYYGLLNIKKRLLLDTALNDATLSLGLEDQIKAVVQKLTRLQESELEALNYNPVPIAKKFTGAEILLKTKILGYINTYYPLIREEFKELDGKNGFLLQVLSEQIRGSFLKMVTFTDDKVVIFNHIVQWVKEKTQSSSTEACEATIAFFVQNCEVFYEITE